MNHEINAELTWIVTYRDLLKKLENKIFEHGLSSYEIRQELAAIDEDEIYRHAEERIHERVRQAQEPIPIEIRRCISALNEAREIRQRIEELANNRN